ncbi:protoporphyrinogen oxidase [Rhizobiaceae bacterium n13]|uniref:flavodoxin domain-containing protein n=1 Tax=Ferirhizobium litorale TaxID=2927786 RepID=UPI0024B2FFE7|nr:flavodoxin domain-containing protein [Fererhizobium litorale]MDI7863266.1 protoporphyrinogen oxidase [Fererhizobium litorale]
MTVLVGYTTVEGQTRRIAEAIAKRIEAKGERVALLDIGSNAEYELERPRAVILCAPVHTGSYPQPFRRFVAQEKDWLNALDSALVSVSLLITSHDAEEKAEAMNYPDALIAESGWLPRQVHHAAGALKFAEYDFFKRWMARRVLAKDRSSGKAKVDHEFTDWKALEGFVDEFLATTGC